MVLSSGMMTTLRPGDGFEGDADCQFRTPNKTNKEVAPVEDKMSVMKFCWL